MWTVGITEEIKLRFRDGLVWTVGLTEEIKLRFRDGLVWTVGPTEEIKLRFRDGLVWTVDLTVEIKLRFQVFRRSLFCLCFPDHEALLTKIYVPHFSTLSLSNMFRVITWHALILLFVSGKC